MNFFKYKLFAFIFGLFRIFGVNERKISFIVPHSANIGGNIQYVYNELKSRDNFQFNFVAYSDYRLSPIKKIISYIKVFTTGAYNLARSKYIFLNGEFRPLAFMKINKETVVVQLWHGSGAFKKFGLSSVKDPDLIYIGEKVSHNLDIIPISSKNLIKFYTEAFGVEEEKILPLGVPRIDYYFENHDIDKIREDFNKKYPKAKGKKLVLYAPTFRESEGADEKILDNFDYKKFNKELSDEYFLIIKLHPIINQYNDLDSNEFFTNLTNYENEMELLLISNILITDYSSIMLDFAILKKPMIFYPYDYEDYNKNERGFFFNYKECVPGKIVTTNDEIIQAIKKPDLDINKLNKFLKFQYDNLDGNSTKNIVDYCLNYKKQ
ncbi:MAG: CDP-glycerol glycerophosphotransferase family protein [Methanobrevibacter sp.]|jgi:CDP-ribitol ribitolphosphotransferase|nr:CDP-glycerol glycerophosphotransferase family protein [Methanobrevibacter sp.]